MRLAVFGSSLTFMLIVATSPLLAQSCAGLYGAANNVLAAYSNYDVLAEHGTPIEKAQKEMVAHVDSFLAYAKSYFSSADGIDTDADALLSQCDPDTRLTIYKADVEIVVFGSRIGRIENKHWLDVGSFFVHRLMLVSQKMNRLDGDLAELTEYLKRAYAREHLSMPQDLLDVDAFLSQ